MKNLKKIGITLTAACLLAFGCNSKKPDMEEDSPSPAMPLPIEMREEPKYEPGPYDKCDFEKVTEILGQSANPLSYVLSDGKLVEFSYPAHPASGYSYISLKISKTSEHTVHVQESVIIEDYNSNGLEDEDDIEYVTGPESSLETRIVEFGRLSQDTQKKITEEYASILKDAPERLSKEYEKSIKSFEKDVLGIIKK